VIVRRKSILVFEIPELFTQDRGPCPRGIKSSAIPLSELQIVHKKVLIPRRKIFFQNLNVLSHSRNSLLFKNQIRADRHIKKMLHSYPNLSPFICTIQFFPVIFQYISLFGAEITQLVQRLATSWTVLVSKTGEGKGFFVLLKGPDLP
jgi:hypothetical protein